MAGVADYNTDPSLNTSLNGIDIGEGSAASGYNNALRQIMADLKTWINTQSLTSPVPVANGGTGQTTAAAALFSLGGLPLPYRRLPQTAKSATFDFDIGMDGGHVRYTGAAGNGNIQPNSSVAFPQDATVVVVNDGSGALTIQRGTGVALIWASSGADANRTLAVGGIATIIQVATNRWFITGAGLS